MERPTTTLFMLSSLDGKISTGATDDFDMDKDVPQVPYTNLGLYQYYAAEQLTDAWSFNTGRVMAKMGYNDHPLARELPGVTFVIYDNKHLTVQGLRHLCAALDAVHVFTCNPNYHRSSDVAENCHIIYLADFDIPRMFGLIRECGCESLTIQSGGSMNTALIRAGVIDYINVVIAPLVVGGSNVSTLFDGEAIRDVAELVPLQLCKCKTLHDSYVQLVYKVRNGLHQISGLVT